MADRCADVGVPVHELSANHLTGLRGESERESYRLAKSTLAIVVAPVGARTKLQPIPPSADWQFHLARGCPAHCQYCYLAGSLPGPPVTRAFANVEEILDATRAFSGSFEASCYTDPLGLEHLTGSLGAAIEHFGTRDDHRACPEADEVRGEEVRLPAARDARARGVLPRAPRRPRRGPLLHLNDVLRRS